MKAASADRRNFITYPTNRVVGTVADAEKAREATEALLRAGFEREHIDILHGEEDLHRLDPTGADHGLLAQFQRTLIRSFELEEFKNLTHHVEDIRAGRYVIMVLTKRRGLRMVAADILHQYGAEFVGFYGRWACEELPAHPHTSPDTIPALFARAWSDRNADALAALFDTDAEFVGATGERWHDRESIRKGLAQRLGRGSNNATMTAEDTKVKLLSPDVAVVHARMTMSGGDTDGAAAQSGPRTMVASFVLHRCGDYWLAASAHTTDAHATPETSVIDRAGVTRLADQAS